MIGIGYEGLTVDELIARLRLHGVDLLVDVRLNAISRKRGYSKRALTESLEHAGIEYRHEPLLGNPRDNREAYTAPGTAEGNEARDHFRELLTADAARAVIDDLAQLDDTRTIALLCYEVDESRCHREQVLAAVRDARRALLGV